MGNIEYVEFGRKVCNDEFENEMSEVVEELFDDYLYVEKAEWDEWYIIMREDIAKDSPLFKVLFSVSRYDNKKFGGKRASGIGAWLRILILETAASRIDDSAEFSDECFESTWEPEPLKYLSYEEYLRDVRYSSPPENFSFGRNKYIDIVIKEELKTLPSQLLKTNLVE